MTRLQKKCMVFSLGLHGLLVVILLGSAAFRSNPEQTDMQIMTFIPANIVDRPGAGGGSPAVSVTPQPQTPPRALPQTQPLPQPQATRPEPIQREPLPTPQPRKEISRPQPEPEKSDEVAMETKSKSSKRPPRQSVVVSYTPASSSTKEKKSEKAQSSESSARAEARRLKAIRDSLDELAAGVQTSGSPNTIVDVAGVGGGEAFASYRNVVFSAYYNAWVTPDDTASRLAFAEAKITIARDGSILSAELARPSDDRALDRSVEKALRFVTKLQPFPPSTHDAERTFVIRFSLEAKEMSG